MTDCLLGQILSLQLATLAMLVAFSSCVIFSAWTWPERARVRMSLSIVIFFTLIAIGPLRVFLGFICKAQ